MDQAGSIRKFTDTSVLGSSGVENYTLRVLCSDYVSLLLGLRSMSSVFLAVTATAHSVVIIVRLVMRRCMRRKVVAVGVRAFCFEERANHAGILAAEALLTHESVEVLCGAGEEQRRAHVFGNLLREVEVLQHQFTGEPVLEVVLGGYIVHDAFDGTVRLRRPV